MATVLIVDNDPSVQSLLAELVRREGLSVHTADDGLAAQQALERAAAPGALPVDVLVCDLDMPRLPGEALLGWLGRQPAQPATVVVSGYVDDAVQQRLAARPWIRAVLRKPFDVLEFAQLVRGLAAGGGQDGGAGGGGGLMTQPLQRLSLRTAGESHGPAIVAILEGVPRGLELDPAAIDAELKRRQGGAGRGGRQRIEDDRVEFLAGVRRGRTTGAPLCLRVANRDHTIDALPEPVRPRPGHADLAGCYRYLDRDIRSTLERASARETCARVAAGAVLRQLLALLGVEVFGFVRAVGAARLPAELPGALTAADLPGLRRRRDGTALYTLDEAADAAMRAEVQEAGRRQGTVGGLVEVHAPGVLPGLGSCEQWHERLDARLAMAVLSIPAIKALEIGDGWQAAGDPGHLAHDPILPQGEGQRMAPRATNRAGGIEGGMTNGAPVLLRCAMKPIATQRRPLPSIDLETGAADEAGYERSDLCAVSAASVVVEAMVALVLADATLQRLGGTSVSEVVDRGRDLWQRVARVAAPSPTTRPESRPEPRPETGPESGPETGTGSSPAGTPRDGQKRGSSP